MTQESTAVQVRKVSQQYVYTSLQFHEAVSRSVGFAGTDHKYLGFFLQKGSLTAGQLAELTGLTTGAVTGLIDRFEKKKLVKRQPDKDDRRKILVVPDIKRITTLLKPFYTEFQRETERLLAGFTNGEMKIIETYLKRSIDLIEKTRHKMQR